MNFDTILDTRIQLGAYQYKQFAAIAPSIAWCAFSYYYTVILTPLHKEEFNLTNDVVIVMTSLTFFGMIIGYLLQGTITDKIGRKLSLLGANLLIQIGLLTQLAAVVEALIIGRMLIGMGFSIQLSVCYILNVEIATTKVRGRAVVCNEMAFIAGILYMACQVIYYFDDYSHGDWRTINISNACIMILVDLLVILVVNESPRFELSKGRHEKAFATMLYMGQCNHGPLFLLQDEEKTALQNIPKAKKEDNNFTSFFNLTKPVTLILWGTYALFNLSEKGIMALMPFVFSHSQLGLSALLIVHSAEVPAVLLTGCMIDSKKFGRIRGLIMGFGLISIIALSMSSTDAIVMPAFLLFRFGLRWVSTYMHSIIVETYPTMHRSRGVGSANFIGKIAGTTSPFIVLNLYFSIDLLAFISISLFAAFSMLLMGWFPQDKTMKQLDSVVDKNNSIVVEDIEAHSLKEL